MADKQATCSHCGVQFSFAIGRGKTRTLCSDDCRTASRQAKILARISQHPICSYDGCDRNSRSANAGYCEMHYYRIRRNGTTTLRIESDPPKPTIPHTHGYVLEYCPGHWIGSRTGDNRIYQHRRVFFDQHGHGPFGCHWCGIPVSWDDMHVDHLNAVRDDNRAENLVSSCAACNQKRGYEKVKSTQRRQSNAKITWRGETLAQTEWAERVGIRPSALRFRLANGWTLDRALTEPRGATGPKRKAVR